MRGTILAMTCMLAWGCSAAPSAADDDPGADGGILDPLECEHEFGSTFIISDIRVMGASEGYDLDEDGDLDNGLAFMADLATLGFQQSIQNGSTIYLFDVGPPVTSAAELPERPTLTFYDGVDANADPADNLGGAGEFQVSIEQFDVDCQPADNRFDESYLDDQGQLQARAGRWSFFMDGIGTIEFEQVHAGIQFAADMSAFQGVLAGAWTICNMANAPFPGLQAGSWLDKAVNGWDAAADFDRDGDGVERVIGNGETIAECIDGDGTVIPGSYCVCDQRIADAYSVAMEGRAVRARITGVQDTTP